MKSLQNLTGVCWATEISGSTLGEEMTKQLMLGTRWLLMQLSYYFFFDVLHISEGLHAAFSYQL